MTHQLPKEYEGNPQLKQVYWQGYYAGVGRGFDECKSHVWRVLFNEPVPTSVKEAQSD